MFFKGSLFSARRRGAGWLCGALGLAALLAGCADGGDLSAFAPLKHRASEVASSPDAVGRVHAAADTMLALPTYAYTSTRTFVGVAAIPDGSVVPGSGAIDREARRLRRSVDMGAMLERLGEVPEGRELFPPYEIVVGPAGAYVRGGPASMVERTDPEAWVRVDDAEIAGATPTAPEVDAAMFFLKGATEVELVGYEEVAGTNTVHLVGLGGLPEAAEPELGFPGGGSTMSSARVPFEVWIDDDGLVRRVVLDIDRVEGGRLVSSYELSGHGQPVDIEVPTAVDER